jgi:hypothetical protein|tara:strand:+ start:1403 stop:1612 length:210 start_codon:yes stop_codon:yes gene_type:complete
MPKIYYKKTNGKGHNLQWKETSDTDDIKLTKINKQLKQQKDTEISQTNQQNQALKQAVCELNPTAGICQ